MNRKDGFKRRMLKPAETVKVWRWLEDNRERIENDKVMRHDAAEQCNKALGLAVTESNLRGIAGQMEPPVKWRNATGGGLVLSRIGSRIDEQDRHLGSLHVAVESLEAQVVSLRATLSRICDELGVKPPASSGIVTGSSTSRIANHTGK